MSGIELTQNEIHQTTAITDLGLVLVAAFGVFYLLNFVKIVCWKRYVWIHFFLLTFITSLTASIYHGLVLSPVIQTGIWYGVLLLFGLLISAFVLAVIADLMGEAVSRRAIPAVFSIYLVTLAISLFVSDKFLVFS
ncbi:hypothetical protein MO867_20365 [Microbulbifer sp. OS29]|uniref:Uncharacterized protein n=1 Tax=Microbulbifer okhotskensis TaxID=2926617 RepID=A0A9X2ERW2_9GAMM|nr:hypothetical protein [Microbulbifer okhotskensis]MCO1336684.1 hypothetical protein [Microbulbifer okhotskensis]